MQETLTSGVFNAIVQVLLDENLRPNRSSGTGKQSTLALDYVCKSLAKAYWCQGIGRDRNSRVMAFYTNPAGG